MQTDVKTQRISKSLAARTIAAGIGVVGVLAGTLACNPLPVASNGVCTQYPTPTMPKSKGAQTPAVTVQQPGAKLAAWTSAPTLKSAYTQFNGLTCTQYNHKYTETPPKFFYYDCVGFTGYTVRTATPTAWNTLVSKLNLRKGYVPTPYAFETFMNGLDTTPQPGWQSVATIQDVKPGDIFAWQPMAGGVVKTTAVGHSVIPLTTPTAIPGSSNKRWELVVMDSTAGGHGPLDTRKPNNPLSQRNAPIHTASGAIQASGLGIGTIVLDTDSGGSVTAVEWSVGARPEPIQFGAARATS
jgi:hypothetical protein